jgi:lysozyme
VPTIGYGSTGPDIKLGMHWTFEQANERFDQFCAPLAAGITKALAGCPTTQHQFDAMFSLAYNIGLKAFLGSSVLRDHKARSYKKAQSDFGMWVKQAGKTLRGLVTRRAKEADFYDD